jgi:succinate-semialdehyde dehydrogenase/glutarate-semialdehyde dehydrogenase
LAANRQIATRIVSTNPATGEVLGEFECAGANEVQAAIGRARVAQAQWSRVAIRERLSVVGKFQTALQTGKAEIATCITREAGKPRAEALSTEIMVTLDAAQYCRQNAGSILRPEPVPHASLMMKAKKGYLLREPYGVVGIIAPWNYPFSIPAIQVMAALVAGNAVVLKPSEFTPLVALELKRLMDEAGLPQDLLQVVIGDGATGAALVSAGVDKLVFTGSVATGRRVAERAAAQLIPVVLELGGKDPMIVLDDADVDVASSAAVWGAFVNAGQTCLSVERCYVHKSLYERFLQACVTKTEKLRVGNGMEEGVDVGPMIHARQLQVVEAHVADAIAHGARLVTGGKRLPNLGENFYQPTVLAEVHPEMRIMREETFGPVLPVMAFDCDAEAVRLANDSEFGLAASVWTCNKQRGETIAAEIQAGTVMVNDVISCFGISEAPHGGTKRSGIGRSHGRFGLEEMVWPKYVDSDRLPRMKKLWWYGYNNGFTAQMENSIDFLFGRGWKRLTGGLKSLGVFRRKGRI